MGEEFLNSIKDFSDDFFIIHFIKNIWYTSLIKIKSLLDYLTNYINSISSTSSHPPYGSVGNDGDGIEDGISVCDNVNATSPNPSKDQPSEVSQHWKRNLTFSILIISIGLLSYYYFGDVKDYILDNVINWIVSEDIPNIDIIDPKNYSSESSSSSGTVTLSPSTSPTVTPSSSESSSGTVTPSSSSLRPLGWGAGDVEIQKELKKFWPPPSLLRTLLRRLGGRS